MAIRADSATVVLQASRIEGLSTTGDGGGVWASNSNLTIDRTDLLSLSGSRGAAIHLQGSDLTLTASRIERCDAAISGGAIDASLSTVLLDDVTIGCHRQDASGS